MSLWGKPADPIDWKPMGGEASFGEIMASSFEAARLAHSSIAESESIEMAFDQRIDAIRAATGVSLDNPYRAALPRVPSLTGAGNEPVGAGAETYLAKVQDDWQQQLNKLGEKYPNAYDAIAPGRSILDDANAIRRNAEETSARDFASKPGIAKYGAAFLGGFGASLRDPVQSALLILGGGPGAARTIGGRILEQTAMGAGTNAVTEAAVQPFVQDARAKAGLEAGILPALSDIGMAGVFGAVLGGGLQGAGELIGRVAKRAGRMPADLPDDARGAASALENDHALSSARPEGIDAETHDLHLAQAMQAAEDPAAIATMPAMRPQPAEAPKAGGQPVSLFGFLAREGGLVDHGGELRSMGLDKTMVPRQGRLVREKGLTLDHAREIAAEAGYFDARYGSSEAAMAGSTINDLLDLLSEESLGRRAYTLADTLRQAEPKPMVDKRLVAKQKWVDTKLPSEAPAFRERVATIIHSENVSFDDALEKAIMEDYYGGGAPSPLRRATGEEVPFDANPDGQRIAVERGADPRGSGDGRAGGAAENADLRGSAGSVVENSGSPGSGEAFPGDGPLADLDALPQPPPLEASSPAADAQTETLLATIEDPASIEIAAGVTLQSALDEARHTEGVAGLIDACRLL